MSTTPTIVFDLVGTDDEEKIQEFESSADETISPPQSPSTPVSPTTKFKFRFGNQGEKHDNDQSNGTGSMHDNSIDKTIETQSDEGSKPNSPTQLKFGPSEREARRVRSIDLESDVEDDDNNGFDDGLWFKGHTPLPSEDEEEEEDNQTQLDKLFNYEHEFSVPLVCEPFILGDNKNKLVHTEHSFDEKDFSRHRKGNQPFQLAKQIIQKKRHSSSSKHRKHRSSKHSKREEDSCSKLDPFKKVEETVDGNVIIVSPRDEAKSEKNDIPAPIETVQKRSKGENEVTVRNKKDFIAGRPKSNTISTFVSTGVLPPLSEGAEVSENDVDKFKPDRRLSLQDSLEVPTASHHRNRRHGRQHHHKRHQHARHLQHKQVTLNESLEFRIKTGMQTLEVERKAIREIVSEIEGEFGQKEIEDIESHRLGHFQGSVRHHSHPRRHVKSGMTTHMSDVESVISVQRQRPHMHIDMEENQLKFIPRDPSHISIMNIEQDHEAGFVELEELVTNEVGGELQWKERARWIKFEEDIEKNERWGKPHVASLSFQSLLELRRGIERGSVLLNLDNYDLPTIFESVVDNMIITDQLPEASRERITGILLSKHCHHHQNKTSQWNRRFSVTSMSGSFSRNDSMEGKDSGVDSTDNDELFNDVDKATEMTDLLNKHDVGLNGIETNSNNYHHEKQLVHQNEFDHGKIRSVDDYFDEDLEGNNRKKETAIRFAPVTEKPQGHTDPKSESDVKNRVPEGAEATSVLVATLSELTRPAMAFVRLSKGCFLGNLTEVSIPVRFLFIIMGPPTNNDYYEIGRSVATLMSDKIFHDLAYAAKTRDDLLAAINSFLDDSLVLAPGDWDRHLLLPLLQAEITAKRRERIKLLKEKAHMDVPVDEQPFLRTGKKFGGLIRDIQKKKKFYSSDFKDGLNWRCFVTTIFLFFATLAPTITFGALLSKNTGDNLGVVETLLATSLCGVLYSLFAGQPLIIVGTTGPILVFELATYDLCVHFGIDFLVWRFWIGIMVMLMLWLIVAFEGCYLVEYFTRFTEEVFSVLISFLFIYEAASFLIKTAKKYPLIHHDDIINGNTTLYNSSIANYSFINSTLHNKQLYTSIPHTCDEKNPNVFLISCLLVLGTYFIASYLRKLRFSHFLSGKSRRVLSDFGVPIAMCVMVGLNFLHDVDVPKIDMPHSFHPTLKNRTNFYINPIQKINPAWVAFGAIPAICVTILLFMETGLTGVLLNKRKNKLKKGGGYNLDLFVMGALTGLCSILGLPWICAATVRSVQHQNALAIMSRSHAPGERPYLLHIKEQRLTNLCIHILMGFFTIFYDVIESIPLAVCLGVYLYLGITSLSGIQFMEQIKLIFVPSKYHPNRKYVRCVKLRSMITYTLIQLFCLICLVIIKLTPVAPAFPFFIIGMTFLRRFIERYFTEEELEELDNEDDEDEFDEFDEYGTTLPM